MGGRGFLPPGLIATAAQAAASGARSIGSAISPRRRRKSGKRRKSKARRSSSGKRRGKPRPGTKAWMAYIRSKRKKR